MTFQFRDDIKSQDEVTAWVNKILDKLPPGATGTMTREPVVLAVQDVGPEHEGYHVSINRGDRGNLSGRLEAVYPTSQFGRMFVIDGKAYDIRAYEVATLVDK